MSAATQSNQSRPVALIGFVLILPALLLFVSGMIQSFSGVEVKLLPERLLNPAIILSGLGLSMAANACTTLRIRLKNTESRTTILLDITRKRASLAVLGLGLFLSAAILVYLVLENLP